jgi:hypothetical protein
VCPQIEGLEREDVVDIQRAVLDSGEHPGIVTQLAQRP